MEFIRTLILLVDFADAGITTAAQLAKDALCATLICYTQRQLEASTVQ